MTDKTQESPSDIQLIDAAGSVSYFGSAASGASRAAAVWRIQRQSLNADGDTEFAWADGDTAYDNVWDDRASLSYSGSVA